MAWIAKGGLVWLWLVAILAVSGCAQDDFAFPIDLSKEGEWSADVEIERAGNYAIAVMFERGQQAGYDAFVWGEQALETSVFVSLVGEELDFSANSTTKRLSGTTSLGINEGISGNYRMIKEVKLKPGRYQLKYINQMAVDQFREFDAYVVIFFYEPKV